MAMEKLLLDSRDIADLIGIKPATVDLYIRKKLLPPRVVISRRKKGWFKEDIVKWLESKKESGDGRVRKLRNVRKVQGADKEDNKKRRRLSSSRKREG